MAVVKRLDDDDAPCGTAYAANKVSAIMRFYPRNDVQNPIEYAAGMAAVMAEYPAGVADIVADPRTGIVRRSKFIPRIAEIAEACDAETKRRRELRIAAGFLMWKRVRASEKDYKTYGPIMERVGIRAAA